MDVVENRILVLRGFFPFWKDNKINKYGCLWPHRECKGGDKMAVRTRKLFPTTGKKRKIRRIDIWKSQFGFPVAGGHQTLDTIEEVETLVRIVGNVCVHRHAVAGADSSAYAIILLNPNNVVIPTLAAPTAMTVLEGRAANAVLWHQAIDMREQDNYLNIEIDVKGQRKLEAGDVFTLYVRSEGAALYTASMIITMFYKKA